MQSIGTISRTTIFSLALLVLYTTRANAKNLVLDPKAWMGEKIVFLPQPEKSQKYGYMGWAYTKKITSVPNKFGIKYEELAKKTGEIIDVRKDERLPYIYTTVRLDDNKKLVISSSLIGYSSTYGKRMVLKDVGFASEFNLAQKFNDIEVWSNRVPHISTTTIEPQDGDYFGKLPISNLERCKINGIDWGFTHLAPIRFNLLCDGNKSGFWDGSIYADNSVGVFSPFPISWHTNDPKSVHPQWTDEIWKSIEATKIKIGMTPEMAEMSWGKPQKVNQTTGAWGIHEQWIYDDQYLYFENGKLTSFQSPK